MVANKTDVVPYESLPAHTRAAIEEVARNCNAELIPASNISEENISKLKMAACDKLLEARYVRNPSNIQLELSHSTFLFIAVLLHADCDGIHIVYNL